VSIEARSETVRVAGVRFRWGFRELNKVQARFAERSRDRTRAGIRWGGTTWLTSRSSACSKWARLSCCTSKGLVSGIRSQVAACEAGLTSERVGWEGEKRQTSQTLNPKP